jgi:class 3 adenylate cyclase/CHAT domain-containing protein
MSEKDKPSQLDEILRKRKELDEIIDTRFKRPVTILFTDIVGSTRFFTTRGDIEGRLMIQRHNDLLSPLVSEHQGTLVEIVGDALLASFEEPSNAVACAVRMQEVLDQDNRERPEQDQIQIRIGLNLDPGFVEAGHVYGVVVHIAERIKSLADGGQIFISESIYRALQPGRDPLCVFLDKVQVKGKEGEIKVYRVAWKPEEGSQRHAVRQAKLEGSLVLEVSRANGRIKVSVYEKSDGGERTLLPYETSEVAWEQVEASCREVISLLNRANKRARVTPEILDGLKKSGQILFDLLIPPKARQQLTSTTARNLILYVDDRLVQIPWELLYNGKEFLCRRFAMGRIVSTRQALTSHSSRTLKAPFKVLVLADPRGDLNASYREGTEIKNFLDEKRKSFHVDFKSHPADISFVKKNLRDYDIVHYAGHADYHFESPSESGWLLTGGRLKASEISAMGGLQAMPSLVFSNACQTGQTGEWQIQEGYEQQIFGLANAHLLAGVQHYIGTFWEILDEPSSYFAKRFYSFLAEGEKVGEAVRRARQELIEAYGEETIVWASYMLYGDPTFQFASAEREEAAGAPRRELVQPDWQQVIRGEKPAPTSVAKSRRSPLLYPLLGVLLLALAFSGYYLFYPGGVEEEKLASAPVTTLTPVSPPDAVKETERNAEVEERTEFKKRAIVTQAKKGQEVAKAKETAPTAKAKEVTLAPVAKPQEAAPQPEVKQEVAVKKEAPAQVVAAPLSLRMNIIGQRKEADGGYTEVLVSEGSVLRSHDNFQVHLETSRPAYVYILIYDSQGKASQIFPDPKIDQPGFAEGGGRVVIPAKDLWFWLDEHTGTETVYVLASEKPMSDIQGLLAKMERVDEAGQKRVSQQIKERIAVMQRGVGGVTKGQAVTYMLSDGKRIQKVTEVVTGTGSVVRAVSFHHK